MSFDAYLLITFLAATVLLISMHTVAWVFWGVLLLAVLLRLGRHLIVLLR